MRSACCHHKGTRYNAKSRNVAETFHCLWILIAEGFFKCKMKGTEYSASDQRTLHIRLHLFIPEFQLRDLVEPDGVFLDRNEFKFTNGLDRGMVQLFITL